MLKKYKNMLKIEWKIGIFNWLQYYIPKYYKSRVIEIYFYLFIYNKLIFKI